MRRKAFRHLARLRLKPIRYAPEAMRDMDAVWGGVWEASGRHDLADQYGNEFADAIAEKKRSRFPGFRCAIAVCLQSMIPNFKAYKAFYHVRDDSIKVTRDEAGLYEEAVWNQYRRTERRMKVICAKDWRKACVQNIKRAWREIRHAVFSI